MATRRAKGVAREELLVDAAAQAIAELGLANVRVCDVAERAQMSAGHVTYYFPSKNDLLMLAIRRSEEVLLAEVEVELRELSEPWERLTRLIELSAAQQRGDPGWVLWFEVWSRAALDPALAVVHGELDAQWRAILSEVIRYGGERGAFDVVDPEVTASLLSATIDGLSVQLTVGASDMDWDRLIELCLAAAKAYLGPRRR